MQRRKFVRLIGGAAVVWPLTAHAQQIYRTMRRIGVLMGFDAADPEAQTFREAFRLRLKELGWIDGTNVTLRVSMG